MLQQKTLEHAIPRKVEDYKLEAILVIFKVTVRNNFAKVTAHLNSSVGGPLQSLYSYITFITLLLTFYCI